MATAKSASVEHHPKPRYCFRFSAGFVLIILLIPRFAAAQNNGQPAVPGSSIFFHNCAVCHGAKGQGKIGPSLQASHDLRQVMNMVRKGGTIMPSFSKRLSANDIRQVAMYVTQRLARVSLSGGNLACGGVVYRLNCAACHRTAARGGALAFAKHNAPALTGVGASTIAWAVRSGPGPMPIFPRSVIDDADLASLVKYVQFVRQPPHPGGFPLHYYGPVAEGAVAAGAVVCLAVLALWIENKGRG
jgi:ubiquinol-cytochrome c reductase cytochrome c subunit